MGRDEIAMKIAGHELKSLENLFSCFIEGLSYPLLSLIDFKGYRLVALSLLPINGKTLQFAPKFRFFKRLRGTGNWTLVQ